MYRFLCWEVFSPVSEIDPATPAVDLSFLPRLVSLCWGECFQLRLHGVHGHSHMFQLCHYCGFRSGKDHIGLCQFFQIVALGSHSLHDCLFFFEHLMVLFWRRRWCTIDGLHCCGVPAFSCGCYCYFSLSVRLVGKQLYLAHVLRSADCSLRSLISSLKIAVCVSRVIPFEIIIASEIVLPPNPADFPPFLTVQLFGIGVHRGRMAPSSWLCFPWGRFRWLPCSCKIYAAAWLARTPVQNLWVDIPVRIRILVPSPWRSTFSRLRPRRCIFETVLGFVGKLQFRALVLGRSPCSVVSRLGCAEAQTWILSIPCTPWNSLSAWDVCVGHFQGSTLCTPHS